MRYRITNGVIEFFRNLFDNTIYVSDVKEAFDKFYDYCGRYEGSKDESRNSNLSPAVIAITRRSCEPMYANTPRMNYVRGRFSSPTLSNTIRTTAVIDMKVTYDITVLSYDQYATDTIVDELYLKLLSGSCEFTYKSGAKSVTNPEEDEVVKSYLKLEDNGAYGELSEAVDVPHSGRIYRTTFSVFTIGGLFYTGESKRVLKVPIEINPSK